MSFSALSVFLLILFFTFILLLASFLLILNVVLFHFPAFLSILLCHLFSALFFSVSLSLSDPCPGSLKGKEKRGRETRKRRHIREKKDRKSVKSRKRQDKRQTMKKCKKGGDKTRMWRREKGKSHE